MKTIYALLVGVDNYPPPTPKLGGAKNDVYKIKTYLEKNFSDRPLHIKTLLDQEATYDNFIDSFRTHLGQAGSDDVVWFHYSGHGSRQFSAPEFVELNSGGRDETMVFYDSRPSGQDLADKEMAVLLSELSEKDPHIMVTLDCCHSGSGTRGADDYIKRLSVDRIDKRTLDSYLRGFYKSRSVTDIPRSKYLFFAACNRFQSAKESFSGGGLFTENLIQTLEKSKKDISYADLLIKLRQGVVKMKWDQDPQLEVVGDINSYVQFLDGTQSNEAPKYALSFTDEGWMLEAGQILGINEEVKLSILSDQSNKVLGNGQVTKSSAQKSIISSTVTLKPDEKYWAIPLNLPGIPFETGLNTGEENVQKFKMISERLLNVRFHSPSESDDTYVIDERGDFFELTSKEKNEVILKSNIKIEQATVELVNKLDQIGLWTRFFGLQNNKSGLNPSCCSMSIDIMNTSDQFENFQPGEINLKNDGSRIPYRLWIQNLFTQPLHFALIYLSDHFGAVPLKNEPLEKSESPTLFWGGTENDVFMIPEGVTSSSDTFLIIISTERTDDFQFSLEEIEFGEIKVDMRAIPGMNKNTKFKGEWFTMRFVINLDR